MQLLQNSPAFWLQVPIIQETDEEPNEEEEYPVYHDGLSPSPTEEEPVYRVAFPDSEDQEHSFEEKIHWR